MAIDVKGVIVQSFLDLLSQKPLAKISVKDILVASGCAKGTFYHHFLDKLDLMIYIYDTKIVGDFDGDIDTSFPFAKNLETCLLRMQRYGTFMQQIIHDEQMVNHMIEHTKAFDRRYLSLFKPIDEQLGFASDYHALACTYLTISWLASGMKEDVKQLTRMMLEMRFLGMENLLPANPFQ